MVIFLPLCWGFDVFDLERPATYVWARTWRLEKWGQHERPNRRATRSSNLGGLAADRRTRRSVRGLGPASLVCPLSRSPGSGWQTDALGGDWDCHVLWLALFFVQQMAVGETGDHRLAATHIALRGRTTPAASSFKSPSWRAGRAGIQQDGCPVSADGHRLHGGARQRSRRAAVAWSSEV